MSRRAQENLVALLFFLVFVAFIAGSMNYGFRARLVPVPIAIAGILLLLAQVYLQNFRPDIKLEVDQMDMFAKASEEALAGEEEPEEKPQLTVRKEAEAFGLVAVFLAGVLLLGMMVAAFLYMAGYFYFIGKEKWYKSLVWSGGTMAVLYVMFVMLIQVNPYAGLLGSILFPE